MAAPTRDLIVNLIGKTSKLITPLQGASAQMSKIGSTLSRTLTPAAAALGVGMALAAREFNGGVDALRVGTGETGKELSKLTGQMKSVSADATLASIGMERVGSIMADVATRTGATGSGLEDLTTKFGQLERMGIPASVGAVTRVFGDWSIATEDQSAVMDTLFVASQNSGVSIDALSEKVVQFGAPLRNLGFGFEEATALLASFEKNGVNTETVMAGLRQGIGKLAKTGEEIPATFRRVITEIENAETASEATRLSMELFGQDAGPDLADAIQNGQFAVDDMAAAIADSSDTIEAAAESTTRLSDKFAALKNKVIGIVGPFGEVGSVVAGVVAGIGPLLFGLGSMIPAFDAVKTAIMGMSATMAASVIGMAALVVTFLLLSTRTSEAAKQQKLFQRRLDKVNATAKMLQSTFDGLTITSQSLITVTEELVDIGVADMFDAAGLTGDALTAALDNLGATVDLAGTAMTGLENSGLDTTGMTEDQIIAIQGLTAAWSKGREAAVLASNLLANDATSALNDTGDAAADAADDMLAFGEAAGEATQSFSELVGLFISDEAAIANADLLLERLGEKTADLTDDNGDLTESLAESRVSFFRQADQIARTAQAMSDAGVPAAEISKFIDAGKQSVIDFGDAAGIKLSDVREFSTAMDSLDKTVNAKIVMSFDTALANIDKAFEGIPNFHQGGTFQAPTRGGEGLAVLRDGEKVLRNGAGGATATTAVTAGPTVIQLVVDGSVLAEAVAEANLNAGGQFK